MRSRTPAVFAQDSWLVTGPLRINVGLRWEGQRLIDSNGEVAQGFEDQWQPRIGFVWQPGQLGSQRVYGSAGRFYQDMALNAATADYNAETVFRFTSFDQDPREDPTGGEVLFEIAGEVLAETPGLKGQSYDELSLGYDRQLGRAFKACVRGIVRRLNYAVVDAIVDFVEGIWAVGNPGV